MTKAFYHFRMRSVSCWWRWRCTCSLVMSDSRLWSTVWNQVKIIRGDQDLQWSQNSCWREKAITLLFSQLWVKRQTLVKIQYPTRKYLTSYKIAQPCNSVKGCLLVWLLLFCLRAELFESLSHKTTSIRPTSLKYHIHHVTPCSEIVSGIHNWHLKLLLKPLWTWFAGFSF